MILKRPSRPVVVATLSAVAVLGAGGALTRLGPWYVSLRKPSWQPPGWVFPAVWNTIGVLTVWSAAAAWKRADTRTRRTTVIALFAANGVLNTLWSGLFFTAERPDWALVEVVPLWLSIAALIGGLAPFAPLSAILLVPYLLWVTIAAVLNGEIVRLNRPFGLA